MNEVGIHVGNSGGNFSSVDNPTQVSSLVGNSIRVFHWTLSFQELIPIGVSSSEHFSSLDILSVFGHFVLTEEQELPVPNFISEHKVSKETNIRVGEEEWFVKNDVTEVSQISMEGVILELGCVKMSSCVFVNSEFSNDSLEIVQGKEVGVVSAWNNESSSSSGIG